MNDTYTPPEVMDAADQEAEQQAQNERDNDLLAAIRAHESDSIGGESDDLSVSRAKAIDYYLATPGLAGDIDDIEGRSKVLSKDVFDTIEWIKPSLLRIFAGGDTIAQFQPQGEEDIEAAEQESDYVDYVIQRKNPWFMICYEWFTDALMTRNAYTFAFWEKTQEAVLERYQGLTHDQFVLLAFDPNVEIVAYNQYPVAPPIPVQMQAGLMMQGVQLPPVMAHDVELRRVKEYGCAKILTLPPERCLVAQQHKSMSVRDADFFEYWEYKSLTDLRNAGFDVDDDISDSSSGVDTGLVDQARDISQDTQTSAGGADVDPAMRRVKARMIWMRFDYDEDGIAERRYICCVGDTILANQEITCTPVAGIVPYPMPHRHIGLSLFDVIADLQLIRSAMLRGIVDNRFLANNGRTAVDSGRVNLDDMLVSRPGGVVRVTGSPGDAIMPFTHADTSASGINFMDYLDGVRQQRTGVNPVTAGADMASIMAQPGTVAQLTSAASQKMELIARIFAEGVKELFQIVHELTLTNATSQDKVELRGKWVTVDPRAWKKRNDMTLMVGLGVGNRQQHAAGISALMGLQEKVLPLGLTSPAKVYASLSEFTKALGFASGKQFFDEPPPGAKFQQPPDPKIVAAQIQAQADLMLQAVKNSGATTITQMREEAASARSYFETMIDNQNQAQDRFVRTVSEITDRMQEMRLADASRETKAPTQADGFALSEAVQRAEKAVSKGEDNAKALLDRVSSLEMTTKDILGRAEQLKKPRRSKIKTSSGKTYTVEEDAEPSPPPKE